MDISLWGVQKSVCIFHLKIPNSIDSKFPFFLSMILSRHLPTKKVPKIPQMQHSQLSHRFHSVRRANLTSKSGKFGEKNLHSADLIFWKEKYATIFEISYGYIEIYMITYDIYTNILWTIWKSVLHVRNSPLFVLIFFLKILKTWSSIAPRSRDVSWGDLPVLGFASPACAVEIVAEMSLGCVGKIRAFSVHESRVVDCWLFFFLRWYIG